MSESKMDLSELQLVDGDDSELDTAGNIIAKWEIDGVTDHYTDDQRDFRARITHRQYVGHSQETGYYAEAWEILPGDDPHSGLGERDDIGENPYLATLAEAETWCRQTLLDEAGK